MLKSTYIRYVGYWLQLHWCGITFGAFLLLFSSFPFILKMQTPTELNINRREIIMGSIIVASITVIGSFILVYLNSIKDRFHQKTLVQKEQLENFYIPFYQLYCHGFLTELNLSEMSSESRGKFLDLMSENIHLMQPKSQAMYTDFYHAFLNLLEAEDENPDYPLIETRQAFDSVFNKLSDTVLTEYKGILKKLYLPIPELQLHK